MRCARSPSAGLGGIVAGVLVPLILIFLAIAAATGMAYGTQPQWAQYAHGLKAIVLMRQLQWPLTALSIVLCIALIALVISGKRRAWWLIGLGPVLALFVHRFATDPNHRYAIVENPLVVPAASVNFLADGDYVVGIVLEGTPYAYPYAALYRSPVVLQSNRDKRCLLLWSPFANRASAVTVDHEIKARELEVIGMPSDALLLYDSRFGQFINGLTGRTLDQQKPTAFHTPVETFKMTWEQWKDAHPDTQVMECALHETPQTALLPKFPLLPAPRNSGSAVAGGNGANAGKGGPPAVQPTTKNTASTIPGDESGGAAILPPSETRIAFVAATQPIAIPADAVNAEPLNVPGATYLVLWRDASSGIVHAFDRRVGDDLFPAMARKIDPKKPEAFALFDRDSGSTWVLGGKLAGGSLIAIDGPLKGQKMRPVQADDQLYWGVMKAWYPELGYLVPTPQMQSTPGTDEVAAPDVPASPHRSRRRH